MVTTCKQDASICIYAGTVVTIGEQNYFCLTVTTLSLTNIFMGDILSFWQKARFYTQHLYVLSILEKYGPSNFVLARNTFFARAIVCFSVRT